MSEDIKDIIEILELAKEEIENNDENITATLDLQDLKSLKKLYELYQKEKEKNKELEETGIELATNIDALETDLKELRDTLSQIKVSEVYIKGYEAGKNEFEIKVREKIKELEKQKEIEFETVGVSSKGITILVLQELL